MSQEEFPHEKDLEKKDFKKKKPETESKHDLDKTTKFDDKTDSIKNETASEESILKLQQKLKTSQSKIKDLEDKYLRSEAEIQNAQRRYAKERAQLIKYESQALAKDILPAVDNLERALAVKSDDEASKQLKKGVQMTLDVLKKALTDHGIVEIKAEGAQFDPNLHQAVQAIEVEKGQPKDQVVKVLQVGYQYKDRTLRPAMVVVSK